MSLSDQYRELQKCNQKLSQLTNVNRKALDQLTEGQNNIKLLRSEKKDIDLGYKSIEKLIESLEHKKYEAIQITYRQVSKFFSEMFNKLVPEGKAFIDMIYADQNGSESSQLSQDSQSSGGLSAEGLFSSLKLFYRFSNFFYQILGNLQTSAFNRIDNFIGVKIRVAFTGTAVIKELNQLSGGQKSIVALAFIFAIQKCDPAPFYLFDEVDHALDPLYRKALSGQTLILVFSYRLPKVLHFRYDSRDVRKLSIHNHYIQTRTPGMWRQILWR